MISHPDLPFARESIMGALRRTRITLLLMESAYKVMTPSEREAARAAKVALTYEGLRRLEEELSELKDLTSPSAPPAPWDGVLKDWRDVKRICTWLAAASGRHLDLLQDKKVRELLRDKFTLLASSCSILLEEALELEVVLRAVMLDDTPTEDDPVIDDLPPSDPEPPTEVPAPEVPEGVNPIAWALDRLYAKMVAAGDMRVFSETDVLVCNLPAGSYRGLSVGATTWTGLDRYVPWWGQATMVLRGTGETTRILPAHDEAGWGSSFTVDPNPVWGGRLTLEDLVLVCSGSSGVSGGPYGTQDRRPMAMLTFRRVHFVRHPLVQTKWVTSLNQCSVLFEECVFDVPTSKEHGCYLRNGRVLSMIRCSSLGLGGQVAQKVARPQEGPSYGGGTLCVVGGDFRGFHRWPERAGSAFTACEGDVLIQEATISDVGRPALPEPPPDGRKSHGGVVAWDGGSHFQRPSGYALGRVELVDVDLIFEDPDRGPLAFDSTEEVILIRCGIYSSTGKPIRVGAQGPVGRLRMTDCNSPAVRARVIAKGFDESLLQEGRVLWGPEGRDLGPVSRAIVVDA